MMKHAVASALLLLTVPAMATNDINPWYAGVGLGHANWQGVCPDTGVGSTDCDDTDFAFDLFGGYRFNQNFGLELGYVDLGESDWNDDINRRQSNANGVRLGLIGTLPVNEQFAVNAELGGFYYDAEIETTTIDADDSGVQPYVGVGLNYLIDKNLEVGIRYRHFREMKTDTKLFNRHSVNYWGIQLSYHFGAKAKAAATPAPQPVAKPEPAPAPLVVPPPPKPKAVEVAPSTALYFDFNSSEVTGAELNKLTDIARYMEANPKVRAELIGHTDKMGDPDYNRALGMRRAQAVQQQLLQLVDISADRVVVQSKGESTASAQESRSERKVTVNLFGM